MSDTTRTVLIAAGVALLAVVLVPSLVMIGMMGGGMMGGGMMGGGGGRAMSGLVLLVLVAGFALLALGLRGRQ